MDDKFANSAKLGAGGSKPGTLSLMMQQHAGGTLSYVTVPQTQEILNIFAH